jgi:hypothetical protein
MGLLDWLWGGSARETAGLVVRGVPVRLLNTRDDIADRVVLERLDEALALIAQYAPIRFRHLVRDARGIKIERFPTRGAYFPGDQMILTELTFLARRDITAAPVASSILHEGVHARVHAFRLRVLRGVGEGDMAHEERLCRRAELDFGLALPPDLGAPVVERARASLTLADRDVAPQVDWELAMRRQAEVDRSASPGSG